MGDDTRARTADAISTVCDVLRSTLGPFGANKLIVDAHGNVSTTSVGSLVLERLDLDNPSVTLLETAAKNFRSTHGDGSASVVAFTGALLAGGKELLDHGLHPAVIDRGYREAVRTASEHVDARARPLSLVGPAAVAGTALTATRDPAVRNHVAEYVQQVAETLMDAHGEGAFDHGRVQVNARLGAARAETELVEGVVLDKKPSIESMPRSVSGGVALLSSTVDVRKIGGETDRTSYVKLSLEVDSFEDRDELGQREREQFRELAADLAERGCGFIATTRAVNDRVKTTLANQGILAIQRVDEDEMGRIAEAAGAQVVPELDAVTDEAMGEADVAIQRMAGRDMTVIESIGEKPGVYTLFCRSPDPRSVASFEQSVESALAAVGAAIRGGRIVPGGGAIEVSTSRAVSEYARTLSGREQLAVDAFADALLAHPQTLAANAGLDGAAAVTRLLAAHSEGRSSIGVDAFAGTERNVLDDDPIAEPTSTKVDAWAAATALAVQLLRIDAQLPATELNPEPSTRELLREKAGETE